MKNGKGKVLLYSPYIDILGGGERHILSIMRIFEEKGYALDIAWNDPHIKDAIHERLGMSFKNLTIIPNFFITDGIIQKMAKTSHYEYLIYVSDGSFFVSRARHNYIFAMYPKKELYNMHFINRIKVFNFSIIVNGEFPAKYIDRWFGKTPHVIHPYIDDAFFTIGTSNKKKEKIILTVGRYFSHLHAKRQDIIIKAFIQLKKKCPEFKDYVLVMAGGLSDNEQSYVRLLEKMIQGRKDIIILKNLPFSDILKYYEKAEYYWHAAGYGIDEEKEPHKVEHLGITPLEAMASGCIVFCHASGGPALNIEHGENGFLYSTISELINIMSDIHNSKKTISSVKKKEYEYVSRNFSYKNFKKRVIGYFAL